MRYEWSARAMRTWYYGNDFNRMRRERPDYFAQLHQLVVRGAASPDVA